jgi:hypothetical protein
MKGGHALVVGAGLALALSTLAAAQDTLPPLFPSPAAVPSPGASPSPAPLANTLKWSTASEVENFGYDVFRAEKEDGPFVRLNPKPIPGATTVDEPSFYQYVDADIDPTKGYFYYVESISLKGVREKFTPVIKAPPKRPAPGAAAASPSPSPAVTASPAPAPSASPSPRD